jgi:hypothetical protein
VSTDPLALAAPNPATPCHDPAMVLGHDAAELLELEPDEVALLALPSIKQQGAVTPSLFSDGDDHASRNGEKQ